MDWNWICVAPRPEEIILLGWSISVDWIRSRFFGVKGFLSRIDTRLSGELPNNSLEGAGLAGEGHGWRDEAHLKQSQDAHEARVQQ